MEKLIHKQSGELVTDVPWWYQKDQKVRLVNNKHGSSYNEDDIGKVFIVDGLNTERVFPNRNPPTTISVSTPLDGFHWAFVEAFVPIEE